MKVAIIGAGIAGMSLAHYLSKMGHRVIVFEKEKELGGLAESFALEGNFLEKYYHHIFMTDTYTVELIEELGLGGRLMWEESKMALYCEGKVYPFGTPFDLFKFGPLRFIDKVRFASSTFYLQMSKDYERLEGISAEEFLLKNAGKDVYEKIWEPLLLTKFGEKQYKDVTAAWLQARVSSRGKSKEGIFKREQLGYLDGSLKVLFDELEMRVTKSGGNVIREFCVERIDMDNNGKIRLSPDLADNIFDAICLCVFNPVIMRIAGHLFNSGYVERLGSIQYRAELCVVLIIKGSLSPYYWINISQRGVPFTGLMEHTNLVSRDRYSQNGIVYLSRYISPEEKQYSLPDSELIDSYSAHIKDIFPAFDKSWIKKSFVFRDLYAQPIVTRGHKYRMPDSRSPVANIFINNTTQIYPEDRGMSPGIQRSKALAELINASIP